MDSYDGVWVHTMLYLTILMCVGCCADSEVVAEISLAGGIGNLMQVDCLNIIHLECKHMKLPIKEIRWNRIGLSNVFAISLVVTMIILLTRKSELLIQTSLFDKASLEALKEQVTGGKELFFYVFRERTVIIVALFLMATTALGTAFVYMNVIWYGACSGLFITIVLLRYGLKGILLLVAGIFPHYLIYVPTLILTLQLTRERRTVNGKFCMQLLVILFVVITGCFLECYVNPEIVAKLLKKF